MNLGPLKSRLGRRIIGVILLCNALLSIFATGVQLVSVFQQSEEDLHASFESIEAGFHRSLEDALWRFDRAQVDTILDGVLVSPYVRYLELRETSGRVWTRGETDGESDAVAREFQLLAPQGTRDILTIGVLSIHLNYDFVWDNTYSQFWVILLSNLAKTCLASLMMAIVFYMMVSRHLVSIAAFVRTNGWLQTTEPLALAGKPTGGDEIDAIVAAINDAKTRIIHGMETIRDEKELVQAIYDSVSSGVVGFSESGAIQSANRAARDILGEDAKGWPEDWVLASRSGEALKGPSPLERAFAGDDLQSEVFRLPNDGSGDHRYLRLTSRKVDSLRTGLSLVLALEDVTLQEVNRQKIERSGRMDALGQLTGGIAHDFNNLLATILYSIRLVQAAPTGPRAEKYLEVAEKTVERGSDLTSRLLAFAKRKSGEAELIEMEAFLRDFIALVTPTVEKSIRIEVHAAPGVSAYCDPAQLENALLNLVLNSRDAITMSGAGSMIAIEVSRDASGSGATILTVSDDGPGMSESVMRNAFDPFYTTKEGDAGTGLGLSMVYGFIQDIGGEIALGSRKGGGAVVTMSLPPSRLSQAA